MQLLRTLFDKEKYRLMKPYPYYGKMDDIILLVPAQLLLASSDEIETVGIYESFYVSAIKDGKAYITTYKYPQKTYVVEEKFVEKYAVRKAKRRDSICIIGDRILNYCPESYICRNRKSTEDSGFENVGVPLATFFKCCDTQAINKYGKEILDVVEKLISMYPEHTTKDMEKAEEEVGKYINDIIKKSIIQYGFRTFGFKTAEKLLEERNAQNNQRNENYKRFLEELGEKRKSIS